ncbi:hypothetical protein DY037_05575 [Apilactobacillus micheneri]|uniref:hypothetical protein n=1 Tax=Apilactobacillus micheneri TaxID=1899430 RepID=UPI00112EDD90|nr:hypothetical protein [Apilactobacillus micheneri]TPR49251.1 hypothetical protein DY037_05575 [Apilactobacillus micheneri]
MIVKNDTIKRFIEKIKYISDTDKSIYKVLSVNDFRDDFDQEEIHFIIKYLKCNNIYPVEDAKEVLRDRLDYLDDDEFKDIMDNFTDAKDGALIDIAGDTFALVIASYLYDYVLQKNQLV